MQENVIELRRNDEDADLFTCEALILLLDHFEQLEESSLSVLGPCLGSGTFHASPRALEVESIFAGHSRYPNPAAPGEGAASVDDQTWEEDAAGCSGSPGARNSHKNIEEEQAPGMGGCMAFRRQLSGSKDGSLRSQNSDAEETLSASLRHITSGCSLPTIDEIDPEDEVFFD